MAYKNYIGISRDHSGSMQSLKKGATRDFNDTLIALKDGALRQAIPTFTTIVKCGARSGKVDIDTLNKDISLVQPLPEGAYEANGNTPLFDSVGELINQLKSVYDANNPDVSFVVMVITDGEENASRSWTVNLLTQEIHRLQLTDRWTFVFRVPKGYKRNLIGMGIPEGNILEWEQTEHGLDVARAQTVSAVTKFYSDRSAGVKSSTGFYSTDLSGVDAYTIKANLVDISAQISPLLISSLWHGKQIRDFMNTTTFGFSKGTVFYQLTKKEDEVQDYKKIVIKDKITGSYYGGQAARQILGLPEHGMIKIVPGNHGNYEIFLQSTSVNRKLVAGTTVVYWPGA